MKPSESLTSEPREANRTFVCGSHTLVNLKKRAEQLDSPLLCHDHPQRVYSTSPRVATDIIRLEKTSIRVLAKIELLVSEA